MIVIAISMGVAIASFGELNFVMSGFLCQALGIAFEATRLVSIQKLLSGVKMTPLVSLYFFAPVRTSSAFRRTRTDPSSRSAPGSTRCSSPSSRATLPFPRSSTPSALPSSS